MKRLRCKDGDLALVIIDTPGCIRNVGRFVRVSGPVLWNAEYSKYCWLIKPVCQGKWYLETAGRIEIVAATYPFIEHPDCWLLPIRPARRTSETAASELRTAGRNMPTRKTVDVRQSLVDV